MTDMGHHEVMKPVLDGALATPFPTVQTGTSLSMETRFWAVNKLKAIGKIWYNSTVGRHGPTA